MSLKSAIKGLFSREEDQSIAYALIDDNNLRIHLRNLDKPVLWQGHFSALGAALFTVESRGKNHMLVVIDGQENRQKIATFDAADKAVKIQEMIARAMREKRNIYLMADGSLILEEKKLGLFQSFMLFLVFFVILYWGIGSLLGGGSDPAKQTSEIMSNQNNQQNNGQEGVPLNADELLSR